MHSWESEGLVTVRLRTRFSGLATDTWDVMRVGVLGNGSRHSDLSPHDLDRDLRQSERDECSQVDGPVGAGDGRADTRTIYVAAQPDGVSGRRSGDLGTSSLSSRVCGMKHSVSEQA